jgi:hypothetical protein
MIFIIYNSIQRIQLNHNLITISSERNPLKDIYY